MEPLPSIPRHRARSHPARQILANPLLLASQGPRQGGTAYPRAQLHTSPLCSVHRSIRSLQPPHTLREPRTARPGTAACCASPSQACAPNTAKPAAALQRPFHAVPPCCAKGFARPHTLTAAVRFGAFPRAVRTGTAACCASTPGQRPQHGKATWHYSAAYAVSPAVQKALPALTSCSRHTLCASHAPARTGTAVCCTSPPQASGPNTAKPSAALQRPSTLHPLLCKRLCPLLHLQPPYTLRVPRAARPGSAACCTGPPQASGLNTANQAPAL